MQQRLYSLPNNLRMSERKHPKPASARISQINQERIKTQMQPQTTKKSMNGKKQTNKKPNNMENVVKYLKK